jgi:hypothetical protein
LSRDYDHLSTQNSSRGSPSSARACAPGPTRWPVSDAAWRGWHHDVVNPDPWVAPAVCMLSTHEQPLRIAEFDDLFASCLTDASRISARQLRLTLSGPAGLAHRVQELADRESVCCAFFTFSVAAHDAGGDATHAAHVVLDIQVPQSRIDVLERLATRANAVTAGYHSSH